MTQFSTFKPVHYHKPGKKILIPVVTRTESSCIVLEIGIWAIKCVAWLLEISMRPERKLYFDKYSLAYSLRYGMTCTRAKDR